MKRLVPWEAIAISNIVDKVPNGLYGIIRRIIASMDEDIYKSKLLVPSRVKEKNIFIALPSQAKEMNVFLLHRQAE